MQEAELLPESLLCLLADSPRQDIMGRHLCPSSTALYIRDSALFCSCSKEVAVEPLGGGAHSHSFVPQQGVSIKHQVIHTTAPKQGVWDFHGWPVALHLSKSKAPLQSTTTQVLP